MYYLMSYVLFVVVVVVVVINKYAVCIALKW